VLGDDMIFEQHGLLFACTQNRMISSLGVTKAEQPASELNDWSVHEVRFFTAIYLGRGWDLGAPYPLPLEQDVFAPSREKVAADPALTERLALTLASDDYRMRGNQGLIPGTIERYDFEAWSPEQIARARAIWEKFDLTDAVLVRGMAVLLKASMLLGHFQFRDASLTAVHVARDAAHSLVLARLRKQGVPSPSSIDAGRWIEESLQYQPTGDKFLEDWYEDRVRDIHPDNRFGAEAVPFFFMDDIYDLTHILKEIFYLLITDSVYQDRW
jgi:hypothetical protein